ncbi:unnamed protein product [Symbiodinium natans]|uniref:Uncharacterized protein n=1 Tax=Symbiodinium natans TaxID=878477 RepID=A0A812LG84_9DINO|nr:unnamed protein product [Symbiodinium natans]
MYVQVLRSASLDSLCFYLGGDGAVVLSCADLLNSDRFTCPEMSFDTPGRQLMQSGMASEIRCFGFDGLEDCERADGRLAQQVQSASAFRVACPPGMLLSGMRQSQSTFESSSGGVGYTCVEASAVGSCLEEPGILCLVRVLHPG